MRPPQLIHRLRIIQLNIQILIHALQRPAYLHLILELDRDFVLDERFEETVPISLANTLRITTQQHPSNRMKSTIATPRLH
jgi:hypothetical protein